MPLPVNPPCFIDSKSFWVCKLSPLLGSIKVFNLLKIYENLSLNNSNVDDMPTKIARPKEIRRAILIPETNIKINQTEKINKLWPTSGWLSNNNKEKNLLKPLKWKIKYTKNIKFIIAGLIIAAGVWQIIDDSVGTGIFYILLSGIPIFLYFKNEFILLAFLKLRKQDFEGAKKWLAYIKNPETALVRKQQGYFNYLHGIMVSQTNINQAEKYFKKAIELGLSMDMDLAVAKLNLAGVAMSRRRKLEATALLNEAKKLDKQNMLKEQITMMKEQMKKI